MNPQFKGPSPGDALPFGVKASLQRASKHKKMVSGVLELKKESAGHKANPTAYHQGDKAFGQQRPVRKIK